MTKFVVYDIIFVIGDLGMDKKLLISDIYKDNELNLEFSDLIKDCFEFGIFKNKPSKSFKDWFKSAYDHDYPVVLEDLKPKLVKQLKRTIKARKNEKKLEEKWKKQRAERGFSDCDSWNIFSWFLEVMTPALKQMRENLSGYPTHISNSNSNSQALQVDEEDEPGMVEWKRTLDRMIFLLQEMNEDTCSYKNPYEAEVNKAQNAFTKKYGFFGEGLYDLLTSEEEKERKMIRAIAKTGRYFKYRPVLLCKLIILFR